jgi:hypothetical protein
MPERKLLFVYNADSGALNAIKDALHKAVRPSTYPCSLCAVTFGNVRMKQEWKIFIDNLDLPVEFLHRNEFCDQYNCQDITYPVAFLIEDGHRTELISTAEIDVTTTLDDMIALVESKLDRISAQ